METVVEKTFSGNKAEVEAQLEDFEVSITSNDSEKKVIKKVEITKE